MTELGHLYGRGQMCEVTLQDNTLTAVKKYLHEHTTDEAEADRLYEVFTRASNEEESAGYADTPCTDAENAELTQKIRKAWIRMHLNKL